MPWTREDLKRLVELEAHQQGVDPRLAVALAQHESGFNPTIRSGKGAYGIFQLMPGTARQLKVNIDDPADNIRGGVTYLKQQLDAFGGDPAKAIAAYNAGPGVVQAYKGVPPYKETRGLVSRVLGSLGPASAEAATPQAQAPLLAQAQPQAQTAGMTRLQELEAHLARLEGRGAPQEPGTAPQTAPAPTTPPAASHGAPTPTPAVATPDEAAARIAQMRQQQTPAQARFLALPSIASLPPEEREAALREFQAMQTTQQEEVIKMEQPGYWQKQVNQPGMTVPGPSVEESLTAPSTMIPLLMPGAGLKLVPGALKTAAPLAYRGARAAAEGLSQTAGWTAGRTAETGQVPSPVEIGTEAAFNVAAGGILEGLGATGQAILRRSQAGKAIVAADEATTAARQTWEQEVATAKTELQAGRTEAYQAAERRVKAAQAQYQAKVQARDATIAANQQEYQQAVAAQQQEYQQAVSAHRAKVQGEQASRYTDARTGAMEETAAARAGQRQYQQAVTGQQQAITTARATPGRYTPETPSWVLYEKFGDAAKDAVVDLAPAKAALADVRAARGTLPDGSIRPFPSAVESIAANLEKATGETSFKTIREELRRLGPLTRSQDGNVRGSAKQLYGMYADVLEASPIANDLLKSANATFRKEMAVQDIADWLKPGHGIVRIDKMGRETINVGTLMTRLEKTVADDSLFRRSFAPDELDALRKDLQQLAGTPDMPRGAMPPAARPEMLPGAAPNVPATLQQTPTPPAALAPKDVPKEVARPRQELLPGAAPGLRGTAEQRALVAPGAEPPAAVTPREALGARPRFTPTEGQLGAVGGLAYLGQLFGIPMKAVAALKAGSMVSKQLRYGTARMILGAQSRPQLMETLRKVQGRVGPPLYGTLLHGLSAAERKALQRETREPQR